MVWIHHQNHLRIFYNRLQQLREMSTHLEKERQRLKTLLEEQDRSDLLNSARSEEKILNDLAKISLLYTSDAADE